MSDRVSLAKKLLAVFMSFVLVVSFVPACSQSQSQSSSSSQGHTSVVNVTRDGGGETATQADLEALGSLLGDSSCSYGKAAAFATGGGFASNADAYAGVATDALRMLGVVPASAAEKEKLNQVGDLLGKVDATMSGQSQLKTAIDGTPAAQLVQMSDDIEKNLGYVKAHLADAAAALSKQGIKLDVDSRSGEITITNFARSGEGVVRAADDEKPDNAKGSSTAKASGAAAKHDGDAAKSAKEAEKPADAAAKSPDAATKPADEERSSSSSKSEATAPEPEASSAASSASSSSASTSSASEQKGDAAVQAYVEKLIAAARESGAKQEKSFDDALAALADNYRAVTAFLQSQGDQNPLSAFDGAAAKAIGSDAQAVNAVEQGMRLKLQAQLEEGMATLILANGPGNGGSQGLADGYNQAASALVANPPAGVVAGSSSEAPASESAQGSDSNTVGSSSASASAAAGSDVSGSTSESSSSSAGESSSASSSVSESSSASESSSSSSESQSAAAQSDVSAVSAWDQLQDAINNTPNGETVSLGADIIAENSKAQIEIPSGKSITLDLNGHVLDRGLANQDGGSENGHVMVVRGSLTVRDGTGGGRITGGNAEEGGGIYVDREATLKLESGAIAGNKATDGAGVFVASGDGKHGTLDISGGEISGNAANIGGGIVNHGTVTMTGGFIADNTAGGDWAGGVFVSSEATFTMNDGAVRNNVNTSKDGGGIHSEGTTVINGGALADNNAKKSGGALRVYGGTTTITGGTFAKNTAVDDQGGAIYVSGGGTLNLVGGSFSENLAGNAGGAVFVNSDANAVQIGGGPTVHGNKAPYANDVCLADNKPFIMTGKLENAHVGVHILGDAGIIAQGYSTFNDDDPAKYFIVEPGLDLSLDNGNVRINSSWPALQQLIDNAANDTTLKLERDYAAELKDASLKIAEGKNLAIDLNGHAINRNLGNQSEDGHALWVAGALTIIDTSEGRTGKVSGGCADEGGGVYVAGPGVLNLESGAITGNRATDGGGVFVGDSAGRLNVAPSGAISGNKANIGGGIVTHGATTLQGALVDNSTEGGEWGGGAFVCSEGSLAVQGATITGNVAGKDGGGIHSEGTTVIAGANISGNTAHLSGGALRVQGGNTELTDGSLSGNLAEDKGGGVYLNNDGTLTFKGGSITGNTAYQGGGGLWIGDSGNVNVSGAPVLKDNVANNAFIADGRRLKVTDVLSEDMDFGVFLENEAGTFTEGLASFNKDADPNLFFTPEAGCSVQLDDNGEACIVTSDWIYLQQQIDEADSGSIIYLDQDWTAIDIDTTLVIPEGKKLTIDLASHTINRNRKSPTSDGEVITVNGSLILTDSGGNGMITGGNGVGGGIHVSPTGTLKLEGGSIQGNTASKVGDIEQGGGGIRNEGVLTMTNGAIGNNAASQFGGGVYNAGTMTVTGGAIGNNTAGNQGGGIYNANTGALTLDGSIIASNTVTYTGGLTVHTAGGGIANAGTFTMNSGTVTANNAQNGGGICSLATTTIKGGIITNNEASTDGDGRGGGIFNDTGTTTIEGGVVSSNKAAGGGGGVWSGDTLNITGGSIYSNAAGGNGGGVCSDATFNFFGGSVKANSAGGEGGGVWIRGNSPFALQGAPVVQQNSAPVGSGLLLALGENPEAPAITIAGKLSGTASIELATKNVAHAITTGFKASGSNIGVFRYSEDDEHRFELHDDGEVYLADINADVWVNSWDELQQAIDNAQEGQVIGLKNDANRNGYSKDGLMVDGKTVTIDLNGYTINRQLDSIREEGSVIYVQGGSHLTIRDSVGTGVITGGYSYTGGGIIIDGDASCLIEGGSVKGNHTKYHGGGILSFGKLTMTGGSITQNIADEGYGGGILVTDACTFDLHGVTISGNTVAHGSGGGLACANVHYSGKEDGIIENCIIENNSANDKHIYSDETPGLGGGIYFWDAGNKLTITNTDLLNNSADSCGGGLDLSGGEITLSGGIVAHNTAPGGGGIIVKKSETLNATDVRISSNTSKTEDSAGAGLKNLGSTTLTNCSVSDNSCEGQGAGIYNCGELNLANCAITGNYAKGNGAGVSTEDTGERDVVILKANGCAITNNTSEASGGGVSVFGVADISNSVMSSNMAAEFGGGIYYHFWDEPNSVAKYGAVSLINGSITNNESGSGGSGMWINGNLGTVSIGGDLTIRDNVGGDVVLGGDKKFTVAETLAETTSIGVSLERSTGTFTEGFSDKNPGVYPSNYFIAPGGQAVLADENGEARMSKSDWPALQHMIETAGSGTTITLTRDWRASDEDVPLHVSMVNSIEIDLAGHTIDRGLTALRGDGQVFTVQGALTVSDSVGGGKICGGWAEEGGGVYLDSGAYFTLKGGALSGNHATRGGGIFTKEGHATIEGGSVSGNYASEAGAGVYATGDYISGELNLNSGEISSNATDGNGGGVFLTGKSAANLGGGAVDKNEATYEGGGIHCASEGCSLSVKGSPTVAENVASIGKNMLISKDTRVTLTERLADGAKLDVATKDTSSPLTLGLQATESDPGAFTYNGSGDLLEVRPDSATNQNELFFKRPGADVWVSDWAALQNAINDEANRGKTIGLNNDINANGEDRLYVGDKVVTVELCGYKLDRQLDDDDEDGHVFEVEGSNSSLTIKDSAGTGRITGGYAENGGAINIHWGSVCTIEGGTVTGNRASEQGGGILVHGSLNMTGGAVSGNNGEDCGGISVQEDGVATLENVNLMNNVASEHGGGAINSKGVITLKNCNVRGNSADAEGGGLYNGDKEMALVDCAVTSNSAPLGGGICSFGTVTIENTTFTGNQASDSGGGAFVHGAFTMTGGEFSSNAGKDCGGIFNDGGTIDLKNVKIQGNTAREQGGAGVNNKGEALVTDCTISGNQAAAEGGGIYTNNDLTLDGCTIASNQSGNDGGGICSYGTTAITDCSISSNATKKSGGALRVTGGMTSVSGGTISANQADEFGGGIYVGNDGATLSLAGSPNEAEGTDFTKYRNIVKDPASLRITANKAGYDAGGIFVASEASALNAQGKVAVYENDGGSNIYLASGKKLTINGELAKGANLGVTLQDELGSFTNNYASFHPRDDPHDYFSSDSDFRVVRNGGEVELRKWVFDANDKQFIPWNVQVMRDYNKLNNTNWMAGLSGEKYLYEINMPGTHDSGTKSVEGNVNTGDVSKIAAALGVGGGFVAGFLLGSGGVGAIAGGFALPVIVSEAFEKYANCQDRYIYEQLQDGIRKFDIRLNTYYTEQGYLTDHEDDGENLWILHGKDKIGGSYFAKDGDDNFLSFNEALSWYKSFLERHPTETIIVSVQMEAVDLDDVYDEGVARIEKHLRQLSQEVNPATNEPFLYMEDGVFNRAFTHYPQLKDCRGKIVIGASTDDMAAGGFGGLNSGAGLTVYSPEGDFHDHADEKIEHLTAFYDEYAGRPLATDAGTHIDYYYSVGTNGTDDSGLFGVPTVTPIQIADEVLPVMFDDPGLVVGREGTYLGLVNMDREHARETGIVWKSNYFDGLEYCTVTVESGLSDDDTRTYTVLKNTPIRIAESIYDAPDPKTSFKGWKATSTAGTSDAIAMSGIVFQPGASFTITDDVTFTAQWGDASQPSSSSSSTEKDNPADSVVSSSSSSSSGTGKPSVPVLPSNPDAPAQASNPSKPSSQVMPDAPAQSSEPGAAGEPSQSSDAAEPAASPTPEGPAQPSESAATSEPGVPASPVTPAAPVASQVNESQPSTSSNASEAAMGSSESTASDSSGSASNAPAVDHGAPSSAASADEAGAGSARMQNASSETSTASSESAVSASASSVANASASALAPSASSASAGASSAVQGGPSGSAGASSAVRGKSSAASNVQEGSGGVPWHLIAIGAVLVLALLGAILVFLRRRSGVGEGVSAEGESHNEDNAATDESASQGKEE